MKVAGSASRKVIWPKIVQFLISAGKALRPITMNEREPSDSIHLPALILSTFLVKILEEDREITGKKYWNNKDVTHQKLKTAVSLGTLKSKTKKVRIECRDYSYVDGDRIRIYINEQMVSDNIGLKGNYYVYYLTLENGYNKIDFQALNQGSSGPNTAELNLYDDSGTLISSKEWGLSTGQVATLGVFYY